MERNSMKDIARFVGVSVNAVSRALADKDDISDGTQGKAYTDNCCHRT